MNDQRADQHLGAKNAGQFRIGDDLEVNRLGFGAMRVTGPGVWGPPDNPEDAIRLLRRVVELDTNFIDTADSYGPAVSETLIAAALYPYPEYLVIATKVGSMRPGRSEWIANGKPSHVKQACEDSLKRLKLETIDLYQLHRVDPEVPLEETLGAFLDLKQEGKIRHIGLSNVTVAQLEQAMRVAPIVSVQDRYSVLDRENEEVVKACEQNNLGFIPWFPLAAGGVAENKQLKEIASRHDATVFQIGIAWHLHKSPVIVPIPGTSSIRHLEENVAAASIKLSEEDLSKLDAIAPNN